MRMIGSEHPDVPGPGERGAVAALPDLLEAWCRMERDLVLLVSRGGKEH